MRRSRVRSGLRLLGVVALIVPVLTEEPATAAAETSVSRELQPLADCFRAKRRVAGLFLIDESQSLQTTDRHGERVTGMKAALAGLNELTQGEGASQVDVAMWGFSVHAHERQGWTALNTESLAALQQQAEGFRTRDLGFDTDYIEAVQAARRELAVHVAAMDPTGERPVCKVVLWFTDGKFDIDDRLTAKARTAHGETKSWAPDISLTRKGSGDVASERGRRLLCERDDLMQGLRNDGVFTAIVALENAEIGAADRVFLDRLANGEAGGGTCGPPGPATQASGAFVPAKDVEELIYLLFQTVGPSVVPPGPVVLHSCPSAQPCPQGTYTFTLDAGLTRFNLLAVSRIPEVSIVLAGPDGQSVALAQAGERRGAVSGADVHWAWLSDSAVLLTGVLDVTRTTWAGNWTVTFVDVTGRNPDVANRVAAYVFGDLEARLVPGTKLVKGEEGTLVVRIVSAGGQPTASPAFVVGSTLTASVAVPGGTPEPLAFTQSPDGTFSATYTPPSTTDAAALTLHTELTIRTSAGITLPPVGTDETIPLLTAGVPWVDLGTRGALVLSAVDKRDGVAKGTLAVVGASEGRGCVWVARSEVRARPRGVDGADIGMPQGKSADQCVPVAAGERVRVPVEAKVSGAGEGRVSGTLLIGARNLDSGRAAELRVPVRFDMAVPPAHDGWTAVLLLALALLVPLAWMYGLNIRASRFGKFDSVLALRVPAVVGAAGVRRMDGRPHLLEGAVLRPAPDSFTRFKIDEFAFSVRRPRSPFGTAAGRARVPHRRVVGYRGFGHRGEEAFVDLGLGRLWLAAVSPQDLRRAMRADEERPSDDVAVVLLVAFGSPEENFDEQLRATERDIQEELPGLLGELRRKIAGEPDEFDPSAPGAEVDEPRASDAVLPPMPSAAGARPVPFTLPDSAGPRTPPALGPRPAPDQPRSARPLPPLPAPSTD